MHNRHPLANGNTLRTFRLTRLTLRTDTRLIGFRRPERILCAGHGQLVIDQRGIIDVKIMRDIDAARAGEAIFAPGAGDRR